MRAARLLCLLLSAASGAILTCRTTNKDCVFDGYSNDSFVCDNVGGDCDCGNAKECRCRNT